MLPTRVRLRYYAVVSYVVVSTGDVAELKRWKRVKRDEKIPPHTHHHHTRRRDRRSPPNASTRFFVALLSSANPADTRAPRYDMEFSRLFRAIFHRAPNTLTRRQRTRAVDRYGCGDDDDDDGGLRVLGSDFKFSSCAYLPGHSAECRVFPFVRAVFWNSGFRGRMLRYGRGRGDKGTVAKSSGRENTIVRNFADESELYSSLFECR